MFDEARRSREIKHSIVAAVETNTEMPFHFRARRLGPVKYRGLQVEIKRLVDQRFWEKSCSPWASPIVMVNKKDGHFRLCADFSALNKTLKMKKYALPNINDFVSLANGCKIFSKLDIKDAYCNIPVRAEDRHKLSITTPLGNYRYKYLPIRLATSAAYYQQLMNEVISGLSQAYSYLDDIIIMGRTKKEHDETLHHIMIRLREHGLVINERKCAFAVNSISFLGHIVTAEGIAPAEAKVKSIRDFELPTSKRKLRRYLGMYQFYSKFVDQSVRWLQPLYGLISQTPANRPWLWNDHLKECFDQSKQALADATTLAHPDPTATTELVVDASANFIGCVLQQVKDDIHKPLAFWSKALSPQHCKWSAFDRELFACYSSLKHFHYFWTRPNFP